MQSRVSINGGDISGSASTNNEISSIYISDCILDHDT